MINKFIRPNFIKRYNTYIIRSNSGLNSEDKYSDLAIKQSESLNKIAKHTKIIAYLCVINYLDPIICNFITKVLNN